MEKKMSDRIKTGLVKLINDIKPGVDYSENIDLFEDLNLDSLDAINFFFEVEQEFEITIPDSDIDTRKLSNIGNLFNYIDEMY